MYHYSREERLFLKGKEGVCFTFGQKFLVISNGKEG
jgi:hypothetical protein